MNGDGIIEIRELFVPWSRLNKEVIEYNDLYSFDSVLDSLSSYEDREKSVSIFKTILERALYQYNKYFPFPWTIHFQKPKHGKYIFTGNFDSYIEDGLSDNELILIPKIILTINKRKPIANSYSYSHNILWTEFTIYSMEAMVACPLYWKSEGNAIDDRSGVYGDIDYDKLFTIFCLEYFRRLKSGRDHAKINTPIELYSNVDDLISDYKEKWDSYINVNTKAMSMWGMRRF